MKKIIIVLSLLIVVPVFVLGQTTDPFVSKCAMSTGPNTTYIKDFVIQLPKGAVTPKLRFRQPYAMHKNFKYRFTLCNADNSVGRLIMQITDDAGKVQLSTIDLKTGKPYPNPNPYIDFVCNKVGIYQISFDFLNFEKGSGVGIVSIVK